jgi:hypothetical protein
LQIESSMGCTSSCVELAHVICLELPLHSALTDGRPLKNKLPQLAASLVAELKGKPVPCILHQGLHVQPRALHTKLL